MDADETFSIDQLKAEDDARYPDADGRRALWQAVSRLDRTGYGLNLTDAQLDDAIRIGQLATAIKGTATNPTSINVPTADIPGEIRESFRAVLSQRGLVVAEPTSPHGDFDRVEEVMFERLLLELGNNAAQRVYMLSVNHELDLDEGRKDIPDDPVADWMPHVRELLGHVGAKRWQTAALVLARMTTQSLHRLGDP